MTDKELLELFFDRFAVVVAHPDHQLHHLVIQSRTQPFITVRNVLSTGSPREQWSAYGQVPDRK